MGRRLYESQRAGAKGHRRGRRDANAAGAKAAGAKAAGAKEDGGNGNGNRCLPRAEGNVMKRGGVLAGAVIGYAFRLGNTFRAACTVQAENAGCGRILHHFHRPHICACSIIKNQLRSSSYFTFASAVTEKLHFPIVNFLKMKKAFRSICEYFSVQL